MAQPRHQPVMPQINPTVRAQVPHQFLSPQVHYFDSFILFSLKGLAQPSQNSAPHSRPSYGQLQKKENIIYIHKSFERENPLKKTAKWLLKGPLTINLRRFSAQ